MMKVRKIDIIVVSVIVGLVSLFILALWINLRIYVDQSKPKFADDISESDSILLQKEFGIRLPPQAEITALGYSTDLIVIRIEGVENLPSFLTNSIHLDLGTKDLEALTYDINNTFNNDKSPYKDIYGTERQTSFFLNSKYQTNPTGSGTITSFFLLDGKLVIEIQKPKTTPENRVAIMEIVDD